MPEIRIIGGEFAGHVSSGLPAGSMMADAMRMLQGADRCPVCGTANGACTGDNLHTSLTADDPWVVLTREVVAEDTPPGEQRPRTWLLGIAGQKVRRSQAERYAPADAWQEIQDASEPGWTLPPEG